MIKPLLVSVAAYATTVLYIPSCVVLLLECAAIVNNWLVLLGISDRLCEDTSSLLAQFVLMSVLFALMPCGQ